VPPVAIRLRPDFKTVLTLVGAYSLLHQANRRKDSDGRIVAEIADYRRGIRDQTRGVRRTVVAVAELLGGARKR
jgi:hypothetical protein